MSATTARAPSRAVPVVSGWRAWPGRLAMLWRRSLRFRTIVVTLGLTAITILVACVWMALVIQNDLFQSRLRQVLDGSRQATSLAQETLDAAVTTDDPVTVQNLMRSTLTTLAQQSAADSFASFRIGTEPSAIAPQNIDSSGFDPAFVTPELRTLVRSGAESQWWQSAALRDAQGREIPGVVVAQQLQVRGVGPYELYLAYDFSGAAQTLTFVQATLWVSGLALVALIGGITWFVLRSVTVPIGEAAETSAQLAAGDLEVRLPVRGDDELALLGRSFNAMADSIQAQIRELADLSLVQQRFVSDVSHELRTPLTTIRLAADMLNDQRDGFDPATARAAELMHAQVQRFETLLTDLLEISRYDAGSVQLEREPTSLAHVAEDVIASMHQLAEQHGSPVRLVAPGGHSLVEMDARRIRRIVRNLLGNAIEHGEGRPIVVTVDSDQNAVALGVRDFGLGMRADEVEHVFDRFWRADPSRTRTIGGTGLGLSIALGDARLHGGRLEVWSELGIGSHFVLTLPRRAGGAAGTSPIPLEASEEIGTFEALGLTQPIDIPRGSI
jgi:two-component system, OmpR family, sensor histidine kinase MtrB